MKTYTVSLDGYTFTVELSAEEVEAMEQDNAISIKEVTA